MKKIYIAALLLTAGVFTSCDMDLERYGAIGTENGIETKADCKKVLDGIYYDLRATTAGSVIAMPEFQADMFQATVVNGNNYGDFSSGAINASTDQVEDLFYGEYNCIANINFFLPRAQAIVDANELSDADIAEIKMMIGVAKFARAYHYSLLFDRYCQTYSEDKAEVAALGMPLVTEFNPTPDRGAYPGRSSMKETVTFINNDLDEAYASLVEYENDYSKAACAPNAYRISSYVVEALQARVALLTGNYDAAIAKAEDVINSGVYTLCEIADYAKMWTNDASTELIFVPYGSKDEAGAVPGTGAFWLYSNSKETSYFIPASEAIAQYAAKDVRATVFFDEYGIKVDGEAVDAPVFNKFPGNPDVWTTTSNNLKNKPKPFRLSELYLIAAESYDKKGDATNANKYINALRAKRITGYSDQNMSGNTLTQAIRDERCKELLGEGFRLSDLKRWGLGFTRTCDYGEIDSWYDGIEKVLLYTSTRNLSYAAGDYRYVWPIPQAEMEVNPQLNGQQNPGY